MADNFNTGVNVVEGQSVNPISGVSTVVSGLMGNFERGPLNEAVLVTSFADFMKKFGSAPALGSTAFYSVKGFFAAVGSGSLYIVRIAGSSAAKGTVTLQDRQGTPANTLKIDATSEGAWGNNLSVGISDYNILSTTPASDINSGATEAVLTSVGGLEVGSDVELDNGTNQEIVRIIQIDASTKTIYWTGGLTNSYPAASSTVKSQEFTIKVYDKGLLVEAWNGLSMNDAVSFFCEKKVVSDYITAIDLKSTDTDYQDMPAVTSSNQPLTSGDDGLTDVDADDYKGSQASKTGKYAFDAVPNLFRFCCPNPVLTDSVPATAYEGLVQDLLDYANGRVKTEYYVDPLYNKTIAEMTTFVQKYEGRRFACFAPWGTVTENGLVKNIPLSSLAMGAAVSKDYRVGVHKSVGNESLPYITGLSKYYDAVEAKTLTDVGINPVRVPFAGSGIRVYGAVTRSAVSSWKYLHVSELWNYIASSLEVALQDVVFQPNDSSLWSRTKRRIENFLNSEIQKGSITAFAVAIDSTINTQTSIANGELNIEIEYVPVGTAEKVVVKLTSSPAGLSVSS